MDTKKTEDYLKNLEKPAPPMPEQKEVLKVTLMNARKSSIIGLILVALPAILISLFVIQHLFNLDPIFTKWIDRGAPSFPNNVKAILFFIFLVGFPLIAIVINILSISYFRYDKIKKEFDITIKVRWWNIVITIAGAALASFYTLHLLADSLLGGR
jgi:hypothetical protein